MITIGTVGCTGKSPSGALQFEPVDMVGESIPVFIAQSAQLFVQISSVGKGVFEQIELGKIYQVVLVPVD